MDDLISRQAAIYALRDAENHAFNSYYKGLRKAHKIIADLPSAQPEQHWISCGERLPDTNRDVLLQFKTNMGVGFWENGEWGVNTGDNIYSEIGEGEAKPIAWMPLPKPYEGES